MNFLRGTGVALITPFLENFEVDYDSLARLIEYQISGGIDYLVILGTTGETPVLSDEERYKILDFASQINNRRLPLVAGFGGNDTAHLINAIKTYKLQDYEAILSVNPYYNKPTQDGLYRHYKTVAEHSPKPVILYNVPGRTGGNMAATTTLALAKDFKNIVAIKEASGSMSQCMDIIAHKPKDFIVISGDDNLTLPFMSIGMEGLISVIANAYPTHTSAMVRAVLNSDHQEAKRLHYQLYNMMQLIFEEGNPGGVKALMHQLGLCKNILRLPLAEVGYDLYQRIGLEAKQLTN